MSPLVITMLAAGCATPSELPERSVQLGGTPHGADTGAPSESLDTGEPSETGDTIPGDTGTAAVDPDPWTRPRDCSPGPGDGLGCTKGQSWFLSTVQGAIHDIQAAHPDWLAEQDGVVVVVQTDLYVQGIAARTSALGLCAIQDPNDGAGWEIAVKRDNGLSENFRLIATGGKPRSGGGIYTSTCAPAWF